MRSFAIGLLLLAVPLHAQQSLLDARMREAMTRVDAATLFAHASVLAHDSLRGRATGTEGTARAAAYLASRLGEYGLRSLPGAPGFLQPVPLHGSIPLPSSSLQLHGEDGVRELALFDDYLLYKTGAQTFIPRPQRLVFVGYGIVAPEFDYNDYQNIDVTDAIVVCLDGEPPSGDDGYFDGPRSTLHSIPEMKQRIALSRGARGSIVLPVPRSARGYGWADWVRMFSFEEVMPPIMLPSHLSVLMRLEAATMLFAGARYSLKDVLEMDARGSVRSFPLKTRLTFIGRFRERDFVDHNVAALLPGSDPLLRDSYVICSAHYDHLGVGPAVRGDSVYNGLVDNALGTAAVLELARVLSTQEFRPRRSIVFLFVTGEEKGLLGSQYYCANPLVPLHKSIANLNIDGVAMIDEFDDMLAIGAQYSTLEQMMSALGSEIGLRLAEVPPVFEINDPFASSDHIAFAQAGIPSMLVMEGMSYRNVGAAGFESFVNWGRERYHTPFDDLEQPLHTGAMTQHLRLLLATLSMLANTWSPPQWLRGEKYINARLQSIAEGT